MTVFFRHGYREWIDVRKTERIINMKKVFQLLLTSVIGLSVLAASAMPAFADAEQYLVLGADLTADEKATVLGLLEVEDESRYTVSYVTNDEEYQYLGSYLPESVIGHRALSSALITPAGKDDGIKVETYNINYCTPEMYQNALITAGVRDVNVKVAGPFEISGTAALVAVTKTYEKETGIQLSAKAVDVANNELVTTQEVSDEIGDIQATDMIAVLKQQVAEMQDNYSRDEIEKTLDEYVAANDLNLSDENKEKVLDLMDRLSEVDLDSSAIMSQAENIYNNIKGYLDKLGDFAASEQGQSLLGKIAEFFRSIINMFSGQ